MLKAIRLKLAYAALDRADKRLHAYDTKPALSGWNVLVSVALRNEVRTRANKVIRLLHTPNDGRSFRFVRERGTIKAIDQD